MRTPPLLLVLLLAACGQATDGPSARAEEPRELNLLLQEHLTRGNVMGHWQREGSTPGALSFLPDSTVSVAGPKGSTELAYRVDSRTFPMRITLYGWYGEPVAYGLAAVGKKGRLHLILDPARYPTRFEPDRTRVYTRVR